MFIIGVDCGVSGAIAVIDSTAGKLLSVEDMPTDTVMVGTAKRKRINAAALAEQLRPFEGTDARMFSEIPTYRPRMMRDAITGEQQPIQGGAAGMAVLGECVGMIRAFAPAFRISFTGVTPFTWKRAIGCSADKAASIRRASELFPNWVKSFARKCDDGRAEAVLLAVYGARTLSKDSKV